ncbi:FtsK/SpoIIIE domain-containing protein [Streptomyces sp. NBC_00370]|uniref:FtsK/SpoIIIE domain-containing protein n=2 Tax=unclassified Streptomyces TaxID=2593676 RepID=UPI002E263356
MQIRLTVLAPRSGHAVGQVCDVLVTAPAGTALAAVASALATAVSGPDASNSVILYAGRERLDGQRCALGEPPLIDGAVLSLQVPGDDDIPTESAPAQLHVVAGPDAGGVHLLHGGQIRIGRSADADVPLDDPDVSRLHCAVTVADDGTISVADLGSTNGTALDGVEVGRLPVPLPPGALLRLGESALRLTRGERAVALPTAPDGEGHLRVARPAAEEEARQGRPPYGSDAGPGAAPVPGGHGGGRTVPAFNPGSPTETHGSGTDFSSAARDAAVRDAAAREAAARDTSGWDTGSRDTGPHTGQYGSAPGSPRVPEPRIPDPRAGDGTPAHSRAAAADPADPADGAQSHSRDPGSRRQGTPTRGTELSEAAARRRGGLGAWARRLAGGRDDVPEAVPGPRRAVSEGPVRRAELWPDPAEILLTALGPGPRLWERDSRHPEALVVRLGTADGRDQGAAAAVPVTAGLRAAGSLGLAGPRERLTGLARSVVAQLAALHSPSDLEIVLISTDRARSVEQHRDEWGWLGWLPHLRPAHGQDCRLLLAYDRDQAAARTAELSRRLDDGPLGPGWASASPAAVAEAAAAHTGPRTVLIVDGDPGSAALREATARLAGAGSAVGIHLLCLAETPAASSLFPIAAAYEAACAASLPFRECGTVALLSGDVATALRLLRTAAVGRGGGEGTVAVVDAVSPAWAERFGRALAPLRTTAGPHDRSPAAALPQSARLLDELGLARATPASLMARWASAADSTGDCTAVLGAGPRGPVSVDLTVEGPHLLIEGPAGSGRTELLRSVAASLAAAGRPDRLGLLLVDGAGGQRGGEGLGVCTELPHVTEHLIASDPLRMREFAQALGAELKRRAELLGHLDFAEWHTGREVSDRMIGQRPPSDQRGDIETPGSGSTMRLRTTSGRTAPAQPGAAGSPTPLPRLVVLVDDFDALVAPALGSPGRPAAGSVVRALEAVARDGERLGVHLVAASASPDRTSDTDLAQRTRLRAVLDAPPTAPGPDDPAPGRGRLGYPDGRVVPFQGGRVTGRIPRTATLRPTVLPLEWERMGDPPTRRPVRELGNGPTDLALLASALERAARSVDAVPVAPLTPAHP